jgi:hypothetical protein
MVGFVNHQGAKTPRKNFNPQISADFRRLNPIIAAFGGGKPRSEEIIICENLCPSVDRNGFPWCPSPKATVCEAQSATSGRGALVVQFKSEPTP